MGQDDKGSVQRAAADAARSVQERGEMTRKAAEAQAADDGAEAEALQDEADEHGDASHRAERQSEREAREADEDSPDEGSR